MKQTIQQYAERRMQHRSGLQKLRLKCRWNNYFLKQYSKLVSATGSNIREEILKRMYEEKVGTFENCFHKPFEYSFADVMTQIVDAKNISLDVEDPEGVVKAFFGVNECDMHNMLENFQERLINDMANEEVAKWKGLEGVNLVVVRDKRYVPPKTERKIFKESAMANKAIAIPSRYPSVCKWAIVNKEDLKKTLVSFMNGVSDIKDLDVRSVRKFLAEEIFIS